MTPFDLDPQAILAALGVTDAAAIAPVSGGRDTAIFRVERGAATYALRVFRPEQRQVAQMEMQAMRAAAAAGVPVPRIHAEGIHVDRAALLLDWCSGEMVASLLLRDPDRAYPLGVACGVTLAQIHTIEAPVAFHEDGWLRWSGINPDDPFHARIVAHARPKRLLHLDFHPLNIMTDGEQVTAVLDWANARAGDSRADIARAIAILRLDTVDLPPAARPILCAYERGLRTGYLQAAGPQADMAIFHAWAGRAMLHDIAPRLASNPTQAARFRRWIHLWESVERKQSDLET